MELHAAWAALGAFDAPEHLCAWVEVGESLRRSYEGRPVEGRLLAERALETFERYGLGRGILRARHARAVALYTASEFREAHREFRAVLGSKDATGLDRARAVSGAAFCLAARGRFHEAAKEYSPVRRRLRGEGAMTGAVPAAGRDESRARDGRPLASAPGRPRGVRVAGGGGRVPRARNRDRDRRRRFRKRGSKRRKSCSGRSKRIRAAAYVYLYACQLAYPKVPSDPTMDIEFARAISEATRSLPSLKDGESCAARVPRAGSSGRPPYWSRVG